MTDCRDDADEVVRGGERGEIEHCCAGQRVVGRSLMIDEEEEEAPTTVSADEENNVECLGFSDKIGKFLGRVPEARLIFEECRAL